MTFYSKLNSTLPSGHAFKEHFKNILQIFSIFKFQLELRICSVSFVLFDINLQDFFSGLGSR